VNVAQSRLAGTVNADVPKCVACSPRPADTASPFRWNERPTCPGVVTESPHLNLLFYALREYSVVFRLSITSASRCSLGDLNSADKTSDLSAIAVDLSVVQTNALPHHAGAKVREDSLAPGWVR